MDIPYTAIRSDTPVRNPPTLSLVKHLSSCAQLHVPGKNHLLEMLPAGDRDRLVSAMKLVRTTQGMALFDSRSAITAVDFPLHGVLSVVVEMSDGQVAEVASVGNEGMSGMAFLLGSSRTTHKAYYQVPGESLRMTAPAFVEELATAPSFLKVMQLHAQAFLNQVSQSTACNSLHPVEQRLCRWILMCHDRVSSDRILLTQDFLAQMLGVRRASVSVVAGMLQKAGVIRYTRGVIDVLDRGLLQNSCCDCYRMVRDEYEHLLC
jgi:CRP-like cAMP-binding protein